MRDELREKIAHIIGYHCFPSVIDAKNQHWYYEIADSILALIDAERCVWTEDEDGIMHTGCGKQRCYDYDIRTALDGDPYCPCCGKKVEVQG
jgi:hypothetical protein